ncbi:MAG TPA: alpha/beta hydrolase [Acidimicrobiales bacterium]|nr:alpha/beta hydrolase [Acidimicrobiales bacterium]
MTTIAVNGATIAYELLGAGDSTLAITAAGRVPGRAVLPLALELAKDHRVLLWDRRNTGRSDVYFGDKLEDEVWAADLVELVNVLDLSPVCLLGGSGGARTTLTVARDHPEVVSTMVLWWITGGTFGLMTMGTRYGQSLISAARCGGMPAVVALPELAELMTRPANRDYVLGFDTDTFVRNVERWMDAFVPRDGTPVPGLTDEELRAITIPTLIFEQYDEYHPLETAQRVHELIPSSRLVKPPPGLGEGTFWQRTAAVAKDSAVDPLADFVHLAAPIHDFVASSRTAPRA